MLGNLEPEKKQKSDDRVLVLRPIIGQKVTSSTGLVDPRLFTGGNTLHAVMDSSTLLWSFKYEAGGLPNPLKQKFTTFAALKQHADTYFGRRGLEIVEVID